MAALIKPSSREITRELILEMHGGILTDEDYANLDACTSMAAYLWIGYLGDKPVCAWGLVPPTYLADQAYLWLYTTPAVDEYKFQFVRHSQLVMEEMRALYPSIYGVTKANEYRSIRWLKWLGAKFTEGSNGYLHFQIGAK